MRDLFSGPQIILIALLVLLANYPNIRRLIGNNNLTANKAMRQNKDSWWVRAGIIATIIGAIVTILVRQPWKY